MEHRVLIRRDERGAIEGLPLQLMIAVIVAGIALAIILGWVLSIQTPNAIARVDATPETVNIQGVPLAQEATKTVTITVRAYDQKGNAIPGIVVSLRGAGVQTAGTDAGDGTSDNTATFLNVRVSVPANSLTAKIDVTVEASGFPTKTNQILVVRQ
ncbi:MAG: hypothetical protein E6K16_01105 [Methanobacteriota archaeon]|nr:MAG: hypothetical protein E6K16_01105 [Euryarchaeota archaeon]